MLKMNIHEAKTHLSHLLDEAGRGSRVLICRRNKPVAEIRPVPERQMNHRPIGLGKGTFAVPDGFFDDLPEEMAALFSGEAP